MAYLELMQFVFRYAAYLHNNDDFIFMFAEMIARLRNLPGLSAESRISVRLGQFDVLQKCRK